MKKQIGITAGALMRRYGIDRALEILRESGFDTLDFSLEGYGSRADDIYSRSDDEFDSFFTAVKKKADSLGLIISQTHGLTSIYRPDDEEYNARAIKKSERDFRATALLGAPACVVHSLNSSRCPDFTPQQMHVKNLEVFTELCRLAEPYRISVSQETFGDSGIDRLDFFGDVQELKKQFDSLDAPNKTLCMDTGHTNKATRFGIMPPEDAIRFFGSDITLLHLNENNSWSDQHQPPYFGGTVNWVAVMDALDEIGYSGAYNFELELASHGIALEQYVRFLGEYLRIFVDRGGRMK